MDHIPQTVPVLNSSGGDVPDVAVDHPQGKAKAKAQSRKKPLSTTSQKLPNRTCIHTYLHAYIHTYTHTYISKEGT
jgi:hypothetical protein